MVTTLAVDNLWIEIQVREPQRSTQIIGQSGGQTVETTISRGYAIYNNNKNCIKYKF